MSAVLDEFRRGVAALRRAYVYAPRETNIGAPCARKE